MPTTALYELLEGLGVVFGRVIQEITGEIADPIRGRYSGWQSDRPSCGSTRQMHDSDGTPVEFLSIWATPSRTRIVAELPAIDVETVATGILRHSVSDLLEDIPESRQA